MNWVLKSDDTETAIALSKKRMTIGSIESADIYLVGPGISPMHAVLDLGEVPQIFDLASESGVYVNGKKIASVTLHLGDQIKIGTRAFRIEKENPSLAPASITPTHWVGTEAGTSPEVIFDFNSVQTTRALEVVLSYNDAILDVVHIQPKRFTAKIPFGPRVRKKAGRCFIGVGADTVGMVHRQGAIKRLADLRVKDEVELLDGDFAKLNIKGVDCYMCFTQAPPRLLRRRSSERDPFWHRTLGGSLAFAIVMILSLLNIKLPPEFDPAKIEPENLPDRIASILYEETLTPKDVPTLDDTGLTHQANDLKASPDKLKMGEKNQAAIRQAKARLAQKKAKEGKGAKAKGPTGVRGLRDSKISGEPQNKAKRLSSADTKNSGGGASKGEVGEIGNVDLLKDASAKLQNILGSSAANVGKGKSKNIEGFGAFTTQGSGGLALSSNQRGGGGKAALLGGLGDEGVGGGKVGTGKGAAGDGNEIVGGKSRTVVRTGGNEEVVVMGSIDAAAVEAAILAHRDEFRLCYEREVNAYKPGLAGRVASSFVIGSTGRVMRSGIESSTLHNPNVEKCVLSVLGRIQFPEPKGGGIVEVTYPFKFNSGP